MELLQSILGSVVRHALTGVGLVLVSKGWVTAGDWELLLAGTISTAAGLIWSFYQKWKAGQGSSGSGGGAFASIIGLMIIIPLIGSSLSCAKKIDGETPADAKARKTAVYSAQTVAAFDGFHNLTVVLQDNSVIEAQSAISLYATNDKILTGFDVLRGRLQTGLDKTSAITAIEGILSDVESLESQLNLVKDANAKAKFDEVIFTIRFTLNSIKAVIAATKEPDAAIAKSVASKARAVREASPVWWTDAILVVQNTVIKMLEQSRLSASDAWADANAISVQLHAKNKARIGG